MTTFDSTLPLSLYIHFPWCVKKCPYCDFNSHTLKGSLPEQEYIDILLQHLTQLLPFTFERPLSSIFMGGGTPSLFSPQAFKRLLEGIKERCQLVPEIEITLEANPGTVDGDRFKGYFDIGINRLSLGIQSFHDKHLLTLGRIHNSAEAKKAIAAVKAAGFTNFNCDLMFGLPLQTPEEGLADLTQAIECEPTHLSWYELTIEPNTFFWHHPPPLPEDDSLAALQEHGQALLTRHGYLQYEISAYSKNLPCQHNLNYWQFGDYLAIGAGAHAKITHIHQQQVIRYHCLRHPKQYMESNHAFFQQQNIPSDQLAFEFCLNALRLTAGVPTITFSKRTGQPLSTILPPLTQAKEMGLLLPFDHQLCATPHGFRFLNDLTGLFLPNYAYSDPI
ncbi:MAG: radical SAM family heme chaperone HemW [Candidatus Berkiellales bacterium]